MVFVVIKLPITALLSFVLHMRHTNIVGFLTPTSDQSLDRIYRHMNYEGLAVQRFDKRDFQISCHCKFLNLSLDYTIKISQTSIKKTPFIT